VTTDTMNDYQAQTVGYLAAMRADQVQECRISDAHNDGRYGDVVIARFEVSDQESQFSRMRSFNPSQFGRGYLPPGTYTRLTIGGVLQMSDTPDELRDALQFVRRARGRVLVTGLGLGCVVRGLLRNEQVERIDVIERNIHLVEHMTRNPTWVGPGVMGTGRLEVWWGDAYQIKATRFPPGSRWDMAWHDVWSGISSDNIPQYRALRQHWRGRVPPRYQHAWGLDEAHRTWAGSKYRRSELQWP
jgi:hypothetical protein